ncbi:MAG: spermidine synthase [Hyphomicrobiaceae bacterium]
MDAAALGHRLVRRIAGQRDTAAALGLFAGTIFLSALLLFSVQPMFAKMVLPKLGGSPSVWAVSMCFFQAALLAGYCYAHALNRFAPARLAPLIHLVVLGLAVLALPIGLPAWGAEPPAGDAYFWLIGVLALGVGLPFFAVSANAPLLQAWFARSGHPHAKDPYFLYAASNCGSLLALLAYPVLIEPFAGLLRQASLWAAGFVVLGVAIAMCGLMMRFNQADSDNVAVKGEGTTTATAAPTPTWSRRLGWIGLSFVPSGLLVAFSSYLTTDLASAPFLWVLPLAAFLGTFIVVFRDKPLISHDWLLVLQPALIGVVIFGLATPGSNGWLMACIGGTAAFVVTTLIAHRELFLHRPASEHLTEFYLWMSLGGVLGGIFAALIAPQIFSTVWEYPLLLVLGMACRPGLFTTAREKSELRDMAALLIVAVIALLGIAGAIKVGQMSASTLPRFLFLVGFGLLMLLNGNRPLRQLVCAAIMGITIFLLPSAMNRGDAERSFFGVHRVTMTQNNEMRLLMHGTTIHGAERLIDDKGNKVTAPLPATYYYPGSPMARGVEVARTVSGKADGSLSVGVVGLGAGSMACHSRSSEAWRFYEIDPTVVKIARDASRFTFLSRCRPTADIVLGDARLTLAKEPVGRFDYLVIDAFSSDAVPVHLLTVEAIKLYLDKLSPNGILAMHVSNRHLDLVGVAAATVRQVPGALVALADDRVPERGFDAAASHVVYVTRSEVALLALKALPSVVKMPEAEIAPWSDDYSDILVPMWRKHRNPAL